MAPNNHDIHATYKLRPENRAEVTRTQVASRALAFALTGTAVAAVALAAAVVAIIMLLHARNVSSSQAAQIHALDQANTRLTSTLIAEQDRLAQTSARITKTDPADDANLITCSDLKRMNLKATTGGSVSSVPGTVTMTQNLVTLPAHCAR
jgi:hypothetical protein